MRSAARIAVVVGLLLTTITGVRAAPIGNPAFRAVWERTDVPVKRGVVARSWVWGPQAFTDLLNEAYAESPGGRRQVQYFDKSRMEINSPDADPASPWYVTNGLLVREMITGAVQTGNLQFVPLAPARIPVAGDPDNAFPTYADLGRVYLAPPRVAVGGHAATQITAAGFTDLPQYATASATQIVMAQNGYGIPRVMWTFLNQGGKIFNGKKIVDAPRLFDWLYVTGLPITDAYWTRVRVAGVEHDVLVQAFERRTLTYTPDNPAGFQVEMGNVGQHYYTWRYTLPFAGGRKALITQPAAGATVGSPLNVRGFENGTAFEARITIRLRAADGTVLAQQPTDVIRPDIKLAGPFDATLTFTPPATATAGRIEVVVFSPRDGAESILDSIDVTIAGSGG